MFSRKITLTIYCQPTMSTKDVKGTKGSEPFGPGTTVRATALVRSFPLQDLCFVVWGNLGLCEQPHGWPRASGAIFLFFPLHCGVVRLPCVPVTAAWSSFPSVSSASLNIMWRGIWEHLVSSWHDAHEACANEQMRGDLVCSFYVRYLTPTC